VAVFLLLTAAHPAAAAQAQDAAAAGGTVRLLVKLAPGHRSLAQQVDLQGLEAKQTRLHPQVGIRVVEVPAERAGEAVRRLRGAPGVIWAAEDAVRRVAETPDDPLFLPLTHDPPLKEDHPGQWGLVRAGFPRAWDATTGRDTVIAVIDTGLNRDIVDLSDKIFSPYDALTGATAWPAWQDLHGHGTGVAAVAAAQGDNGHGMAGGAWDALIMPIHVSDDGSFLASVEIEAILYAVDHGADVINISAGSTIPSEGEEEAVRYALSRGVTVVAAAGNSYRGPVWYPAAIPGVIAVGASGPTDEASDFSAQGWPLALLAPGEQIITYLGPDYAPDVVPLATGTSFAAPFVSAAAALLHSLDPGLAPAEVAEALASSAHDRGPGGWDVESGYGSLDVGEAAQQVLAGPPPPPPPPPFSDVPPDSPYARAIASLSQAGVVGGYVDGRFAPEELVLRQQFAKMILLSLGRAPAADLVSPFVDVEATAELYPDKYIALAYQLGITKGTSSDPLRFSPYAHISRAEVITMTVRAADAMLAGGLSAPPPDYAPIFGRFSAAHDPAAARAAWNGLLADLQGLSTDWDPWRRATRGEVSALLARLLELRG